MPNKFATIIGEAASSLHTNIQVVQERYGLESNTVNSQLEAAASIFLKWIEVRPLYKGGYKSPFRRPPLLASPTPIYGI